MILIEDELIAKTESKKVKYDFDAESFNLKDFWATEASLNIVMIAYNLMSIFRQAIIKGKTQQFLKTIRYKNFAIGAYMIKEGNSRILKLSLAMQMREWFKGFWSTINYLESVLY